MNDERKLRLAFVHRSSLIVHRSEKLMELNDLKPKKGAKHAKKRVGRGPGSGHGKTAARGEKGQKSRSGFSRMRGFEGGQMPLHRRLPKRGFTNIFKKEFAVVNLADLERFDNGATIDESMLRREGLIKGHNDGIKILGTGSLTKKLTVVAHKFSESARKQIEAAGGTVQEIA
jgi:large subunit ribosomal protein L15